MINFGLFTKIIFATLLFCLPLPFFSSSTIAATPPTAANPVPGCRTHLGWPTYLDQRDIVYGNWDGTYTVFLYPKGGSRDKFVAKQTTTNNEIDFTNLVPGQYYTAEVFITGAFLERSPYWQKTNQLSCNHNSGDVDNDETVVAATSDNQTPNTVQTLPDTGWSLGTVASIVFILSLAGTLLYKFLNLKNSIDRRFNSAVKY